MASKKNQNLLSNYIEELKKINFSELIDTLKDLKVEDLKNLNYKRLFYDIRQSKYAKPTLGILSASLLSIFVLLPTIELLNASFKKLNQYKKETNELSNKIDQLKNKNKEFEEINLKMTQINSSFLKNEQLIFISKLLNEAAKKSNIKINYFSPILNAESSKLCKISSSQKQSKKFKSQRSKTNKINNRKGNLQTKFYEVIFSSDYLDIVQFLKEIQLYDVTIIPYCLEVESEVEISKNFSNNNIKDNNSLVIPLNESGIPINKDYEIEPSSETTNIGKVSTRIILKIPSFSR